MNIWNYLEKHDLLDTVLEGIDSNPFITDERADVIMVVLEEFKLVINHRAKRRFGQFSPRRMEINITSEYFNPVHDWEDVKADHHNTLLHEVAHLVIHVYIDERVEAHGQQWKRVMHSFGIANPKHNGSGKVLKDVKPVRRMTKKHSYTCQKCGYVHETVRELKHLDRRYHSGCGKAGKLVHQRLAA